MRKTLLILLLSACAACASSNASTEAEDPFAEATSVEEGQYSMSMNDAMSMDDPIGVTWGPWSLLADEWSRSVAGWSFTTRAVGRWGQRDSERLFKTGN
jgi:hypothetical protein